MYNRFRHHDRGSADGQTSASIGIWKLKDRWLARPEANLSELLLDVSDVLEIADRRGAERFFNFWSKL
jgi:hypothetical protein